ncbi:MAG: RagB/SusD family nutrient uptake outer membrane protein [Flavobacteriaceae bacterium]|nr:MAG: RagB/SusD family nutrient uptake outer membrane protein [Flavobacteriaceae bacterium]
MTKYIKITILSVVSSILFLACTKDLDQTPINKDSFTELEVFKTKTEAKGALAKIYAALALTGQQGPAGDGDIQNFDEGFSQFTRLQFTMQEASTDHAVFGWGDQGLPDFHAMNWTSSNMFSEGMYYRLAQEVSFTNSFITNAEKLADDEDIQLYIAEARFLRAYAYYNLLDLYANIPLATKVQTTLPEASNRTEVFNFVESELIAIESLLATSKSNEYGRVDETAAHALLSRLYLNAEVYTGTARYDDCITYASKVINSAYIINTNDGNNSGSAYDELFLADNNTNGAQNEFIYAMNFDGNHSQTWGGSTFLVHASVGGKIMNPSDFGIDGGWAGLRTTKALVSKFTATDNDTDGNPIKWADKRAMFHVEGQNIDITDIGTFEDGYAVTKFKNIDINGNPGVDPAKQMVDTDIPVIRVAEIYLNYAEAVARGGAGGSEAEAVGLINQLRERAFGNANGNIDADELTLDFILDERSRELYWEGFRRTDLVRYGQFTTADYLWPFKGNAINGTSVGNHRNVFPIPANVLLVNPNLTQNSGY